MTEQKFTKAEKKALIKEFKAVMKDAMKHPEEYERERVIEYVDGKPEIKYITGEKCKRAIDAGARLDALVHSNQLSLVDIFKLSGTVIKLAFNDEPAISHIIASSDRRGPNAVYNDIYREIMKHSPKG